MSDVIFIEQSQLLVESDSPAEVVESVQEVMVLAVADQGPRGIAGPPGASGGDTLRLVATSPIGGHRMVASWGIDLVYADASDLGTVESLIGLTLNAAGAGDDVEIVLRGDVSDSGWSWTPGAPLYLGSNGVLTQSPPAGDYIIRVGHALAATRILFNPHEPVVLA